jgi:hypothetical protein
MNTAVVPRRTLLIGTAVGLPLSALFLWLAARHLDLGAAFAAVRQADPARAALAVVAMGAVYTIQGYRWRWIARHEVRLPVRSFVRWIVGGVAVNNVVPGRPGDLLRAHWLSQRGVSRTRALGTVVVDRVSDVLALLGALAVGYSVTDHPAWLDRLDFFALAIGGLLAVGLVGAKLYARRRGFTVGGRTRAARLLSNFVTGIARTVNRRDAVVVAALSCLAWTAWAAGAWLVASALGISLSPLEVAFVTAIVNLGVAIPSSPGFVGTYQWLCVASLGLLSVGHVDAFAFSVLMQAVWFVPTTLAGVVLASWKGISLWLAAVRPVPQPPAAPARAHATVPGSAP